MSSKKLKTDSAQTISDEQIATLLESVQKVQADIEDINDKANEELLAMEAKYNKVKEPFYKKRNEEILKVPGFWAASLKNNERLNQLISESDIEIFKHLLEIHFADAEDVKSGSKITFVFEKNNYFEETELTKEIKISDEGESTIVSSGITWKVDRKNKNKEEKKDSKKRKQEDLEEEPSFFDFFEKDVGEDGEEAVTDFDEEIFSIVEKTWRNPLRYYLGYGDSDDEGEDFGDDSDNEAEE